MSHLKPGTLCVIVAGCPANIGLVVEVLARLGPLDGRADAYRARTASGRPFPELAVTGSPGQYWRNASSECITDRHKLRPLIDLQVNQIAHVGERVKEPA